MFKFSFIFWNTKNRAGYSSGKIQGWLKLNPSWMIPLKKAHRSIEVDSYFNDRYMSNTILKSGKFCGMIDVAAEKMSKSKIVIKRSFLLSIKYYQLPGGERYKKWFY